MANKPPIKMALRKSHPLTLAAVLAAVVLSTVALLTLQGAVNHAEANYEDLRQQAATLNAENQKLNERIESLGSVESAILIAMEKLGLVEPDTVIIAPGN